MAEGILKRLGGDLVEVHSAGLEAHGLNPRAVKVMAEVGIDIAHYQSKTMCFKSCTVYFNQVAPESL